MEKIIYVLWRPSDMDRDAFASRLRNELAETLLECGVHGLQVNISDAEVDLAKALKQTHTQPPVEALVSVWVETAIRQFRQPIDDAIAAVTERFAAYLVTESQPMPNVKHPPEAGERTTGFAQVALLKRPAKLDYATWLDIWHNSHTGIAIDTQSTFEYTQNVVTRALTDNAPQYDAIVEECFPAGAMTDYKVFFNAAGDDAKFKKNLQIMMESVSRFIEPGALDVVPTSQYRILSPWE